MLRSSKNTNEEVTLLVQSAKQQRPATSLRDHVYKTKFSHTWIYSPSALSSRISRVYQQSLPDTQPISTQHVLQHRLCLGHSRLNHGYSSHGQTRPLRLQRRLHRLHRKPLSIRRLLLRHTQHLRSLLANRTILQSNRRLLQRHPMHHRCSTLFPHHREPWFRLWSLRL
jgi:hypothetical protein